MIRSLKLKVRSFLSIERKDSILIESILVLFLFIKETGCWDVFTFCNYKIFSPRSFSRDEDLSEAFKTLKRYREEQNVSRKAKITGNPATGGVIIIFQNHHLREHVTLVRP